MEINLGLLESGPHANLIRDVACKCSSDQSIQAIWVGGSLASGTGDQFSDVDIRIAVELDQMERWVDPDWDLYLPIQVCGGSFMRFGEHALLHHLVLADGTIIDFYVQDTTPINHEPNIVIIAYRNGKFLEMLKGFATPAASLTREINGDMTRQFFVEYWITTHKQMKALARKYDYSPFVGLYFERTALLRAWFMHETGKDVAGRITIHAIGKIHDGVRGQLTEEQRNVFGMPSRTPDETVVAIEAIREEMGRIGRGLAGKYQFDYPNELEDVVRRIWNEHKQTLIKW